MTSALTRAPAGLLNALSIRECRRGRAEVLLLEDLVDHRQVFRARIKPFGNELPEVALEQLDIPEHLAVERDVDIVARKVAGNRVLGRRRRHGRIESGNRQQLVNGGRLGLLFNEAVALRQDRELVGADPLDEPVEMQPDSRLRPGPIRRFQQNLDGEVERGFRLRQVPKGQLPLPIGEMALGLGYGPPPGRARRRHGNGPAGPLLDQKLTVVWTVFGALPHPTSDAHADRTATRSGVRRFITRLQRFVSGPTEQQEQKPSREAGWGKPKAE
jgi:hypothetical protein